ncbi:MAG TPA: hypothetical protein VGO86_11650, partial [Candidatus Dormibacteraeota bacterium]
VAIGILGGFYVGAKYGQGHPPPSNAAAATTSAQGNGGGNGGNGGGAGGAGGGGFGGGGAATAGQITAVTGDTITIHNAQTNRDVKVNIASARITKTADGSPSDLTPNTTVTVIGQTGTDGVVTATTIAIGNGAFGRRGAGASPSPGAGN